MKKPILAIRAVVRRGDKLLVINNRRDGFYYLPGGKLEHGETIADCIHRELTEEIPTEINIKVGEVLFHNEFFAVDGRHKVELFMDVELDLFEELSGMEDPEHEGTDNLEIIDMVKFDGDLKPEFLRDKLMRTNND